MSAAIAQAQPLQSTLHVRFNTKGSSGAKKAYFNWLVGMWDCDYPFVPPEYRNAKNSTYGQDCLVCGGRVWKHPVFSLEELANLSNQVNGMKDLPGEFHLKVTTWHDEDVCSRALLTDPSAQDVTPAEAAS